ncbi:hypothetical protein ALP10_200143 [Pseudomonas syringae pv. helianthi]|uniref:Uncharacterized protein n=1 Tax=Pseudomonas syringae pv. helianthi TaxID=251654 RepID=A0A3M6CL18_9PSED|nr:hypothetical protein ALP10_200143 [Pseudomonas syringae pv. helianthi]
MPYLLSTLDTVAWRYGVPESGYPEALISGRREVGGLTPGTRAAQIFCKKKPRTRAFAWYEAFQFYITACWRYISRQTAACLVGVRGFELLTSCSQSRRATGLRYTPVNQGTSTSCLRPDASGIRSLRFGSKVNLEAKNGGSCGIRTYDQLVKSQLVSLPQFRQNLLMKALDPIRSL